MKPFQQILVLIVISLGCLIISACAQEIDSMNKYLSKPLLILIDKNTFRECLNFIFRAANCHLKHRSGGRLILSFSRSIALLCPVPRWSQKSLHQNLDLPIFAYENKT